MAPVWNTNPDELTDATPCGRSSRGRGRRTLALITATGLLVAVWAVTGGPRALSSFSTPTGNLLANGSFELPAAGGGIRIYGRTWSRWETVQQWFRLNWPPRRRLVTPSAPPELPGWRIVRGTVDVVRQGYWQPAPGQGPCSLDMVGSPGAATIEQTFLTRPGQEYVFSGWLAHNPVDRSPDGRTDVSMNGQFLVRLVHHDPQATRRSMRWQGFRHRFRASSSRTTLTLKDVTGNSDLCGTVLDGLAVTPVAARPAAR